MDDFLIAREVTIKLCDNGTNFKIRDLLTNDLLVARFLQSNPCGCCPSDSEDRFRIFDTNDIHMYSTQEKSDGCCGCSPQLECNIIQVGGGVIGELRGVPHSYCVKNVGGDVLYDLTSGFFKSSYKIIPKYNPGSEGKISQESSMSRTKVTLRFPECSQVSPDHKILLLAAALEITHLYSEASQS